MIFEYHLLFSYFLSILITSLAFGWESVDTCQMFYFQVLEGSAWELNLDPIDFSTDKSNMYDLLMALDRGVGTDHPLAKLIGITHMTFDVPAENDETVQTGTVFGESITTSNFTMTALTFFKAKKDGDYTFTLEATDGAVASILADMSPYCCGNINDANVGNYLDAGTKYIWSIPTDPTPRNNTVTIPMREGVMYYIKLLYMNLSGDAKLKFTVTTPDDETTSDFSNYAAVPINPDCENFHTATTEYSGWTFDSTSTYSSTVVTIDMTTTTTLETVYYVVTPTPTSSSIVESSTSEVPITSDVSSEVPITSDVSSEVTVTSDLSSETPLTSEVSSEDSLTSDASSVTLSDTLLTSTVTSSYASVDTSSTSQPESSISSSLEEADSSATRSTEETVTTGPSTAISAPSTFTTWGNSFLPSWSMSNASFPSSTPATQAENTISTDLESSTTSSNIDPDTGDIATSTTALGDSDKTTTATVLSTTTATVCDTCAGKGIEQTAGTEANDAINGAATSNTQANNTPIATSSNIMGQEANTATVAASNAQANEESSAPSLSLAQGSSYISITTLQSSTPIVFSPENNNGADQTRIHIFLCLITLVLFV